MALDSKRAVNSSSQSGFSTQLASWTDLSSGPHVLTLQTRPGPSGSAFYLDRADVTVGTGSRCASYLHLIVIDLRVRALNVGALVGIGVSMFQRDMSILRVRPSRIHLETGMITEDTLSRFNLRGSLIITLLVLMWLVRRRVWFLVMVSSNLRCFLV